MFLKSKLGDFLLRSRNKNLVAVAFFFLERVPVRVLTLYRILDLALRNLLMKTKKNKQNFLEPALIVSLTSHGTRITWCHLSIESIIQSGCPASKIYLWIAEETKISKPLKRLAERGLNIRHVRDQRSHTKYCYLGEVCARDQLGFLLADDDMIYARDWYKVMLQAAKEDPLLPAVRYGVQLYVRDRKLFFGDGKKSKDEKSLNDRPNLLFHPFSGSGLFLPKASFSEINVDPKSFMSICPSNDDIWIHRELFRVGLPIRDLGENKMPPSIPFNSNEGLFQINWEGGQNIIQLEKAFKDLVER